ncbi:MAG: LuxR C-terminal-related transcriptional regulator [Myxococcota bacterium]
MKAPLARIARTAELCATDRWSGELEGAEVHLVRLEGPAGVFYLAVMPSESSDDTPPCSVLSPRQMEVAHLAAAGLTVKEIAADLGLSYYTAKDHLKAAYQRLGVSNRVELTRAIDLAAPEARQDRHAPNASPE